MAVAALGIFAIIGAIAVAYWLFGRFLAWMGIGE